MCQIWHSRSRVALTSTLCRRGSFSHISHRCGRMRGIRHCVKRSRGTSRAPSSRRSNTSRRPCRCWVVYARLELSSCGCSDEPPPWRYLGPGAIRMSLLPHWTRRRAWLSPWRVAGRVPPASLALSLDPLCQLSMRLPHSPQCSRLPVSMYTPWYIGRWLPGPESCPEGPYTFLSILGHVMQLVSCHCRVLDPHSQHLDCLHNVDQGLL